MTSNVITDAMPFCSRKDAPGVIGQGITPSPVRYPHNVPRSKVVHMRGIILALLLFVSGSGLALAQSVAASVDAPAPVEAARPDETTVWGRVQTLFAAGYEKEPQLVIATLAIGGLLPVASLAALASLFGVRLWSRRVTDHFTQVAMARPHTHRQITEIRGQEPLLDVVGDRASSHPVRGNMIRIGRHEENDIRLASQTVHRYHAVVHLAPEQGYVITDLSGPEGNGVLVNSERVDHASLVAGDLIELGDVRMRFRFAEAH